MNPDGRLLPAGRQQALSLVLAMILPLLVTWVITYQARMPVMDFLFDARSGQVLMVPPNSFGDWAGLQVGDVIVAIEGEPFATWQHPQVQNYQATIERNGRPITLELPVVALIRLNSLPLASGVLTALVFWTTGTYLLWRRPRQTHLRILFLLAQVFAIAVLFLLAYPPNVRPSWMTQITVACFHLAAPLLLHHVLTFPILLGSPGQRRRLLAVVYAVAVVMLASSLYGSPLATRLAVLWTSMEVAAALAVLVYVYWRRATPDSRRRLRLVLFGNLLAGVPPLLFYLLPSIIGYPYRMPTWLMGAFLVLAPASYVLAVARHNLFGIDRLLNRSLVHLLLSLGIFLLYLGPFVLLYRYLPGDPLLELVVAVGLTLLVGLSFDWARRKAQHIVDRLFYGGWYDYASIVEPISATLARTLDYQVLQEVLCQQVPALMQLKLSQLEQGNPQKLTSLQQEPSPTVMQFPLLFRGQVRALWTVGQRRDGDDLSDTDRRVLQTLTREAELALNNALLVEDLRRRLEEIRLVQQRLLRTREEERARLARDLHDGPVQSLVGMKLQLGLLLAAGNAPSQPNEAVQSLRQEIQCLLDELRQICVDLRPPMLDALGLGPALNLLADEWSTQTGIAVTFTGEDDETWRSLPDEVAVNLFRVVQESLSNVARHACAQHVHISLSRQRNAFHLSIEDDGRGFTLPGAISEFVEEGHFGLAGMQERVALIGGDLQVESAVGQGTRIQVMWEPSAA